MLGQLLRLLSCKFNVSRVSTHCEVMHELWRHVSLDWVLSDFDTWMSKSKEENVLLKVS